eukprot:PITA_20001
MEVGRTSRGRAIRRVVDEGLQEEIRTLTARLVALEVGRHRDPEGGDDNEEENAATMDRSNEEGPEIKLLRSILLASSKPGPELSDYDGSSSTKELTDHGNMIGRSSMMGNKLLQVVKYGIKHTLLPMKEKDVVETSGTKEFLLGGKGFLQKMEGNKEFSDIVVDDLPDKIPPKRSISHHIDFTREASLPNKAACWIRLKNNEEIRKQVQELLDKGLIREILSPCAILTVLAPRKGHRI